jgi:hypothetical protein
MGRGRLRLVSLELRTPHGYAGRRLRWWETNICEASICHIGIVSRWDGGLYWSFSRPK